MSRFDENNPKSVIEFVFANLPRFRHFALSTLSEDGSPWTVCVNLAFDQSLHIIWKSLETTEHSKNISRDSRVALCIFSGTEEAGDFGLYYKATAHEVTDEEELARLLAIRFKGKEIPPTSEFQAPSPARIYCATVQQAWVSDDRHTKTPIDLGLL